ncbi:hypothetical protein K501DRAFT_274032 [Backusella circina FSU 941]|nr:hypothetical protein K501DRAFT_274032 [Backusella circina FSU 941]
MKVTFFGLVALASAVLAQADYFQIRSPKKGWENGLEGKVLVNIIKGDDAQMMMPTGMAFMTSGAQDMQKWRVPDNLDPAATYALEFNYKTPDGQTAQSFSDQFKVSAATEASKIEQNNDMQISETLSTTGNSQNMRENTQDKMLTNLRQPSQDMTYSDPSQGMRQTGTLRKPSSSRRVMHISITYPNEGEEQTENGSTIKMNGEPVRMRSPIRANQGSVLDPYAANAASDRRNRQAFV